ncbi:MAG TPA: hypothetical protein DD415_06660 [Clostridiales bacterium]|nr:hypothetical protein [Clostridiales bacterium]
MKRKEVEKSVDRHIRIWDTTLLEQVDKIMEYPEYKSFGKVINEALFIALPIMLNRLEGKEEITLSNEFVEPYKPISQAKMMNDDATDTVIKLLRETVMNVVINKSILSSLFHAMGMLNKLCGISNERYEQGLMSDTPEYLEQFELQQIKKLKQ